jgi:hypothetical protein
MASRSAAEKDGWWPRLGRGGGTRAASSCGGMVELETTSAVWTCRPGPGGDTAGKEGWLGGGDGGMARSCGG